LPQVSLKADLKEEDHHTKLCEQVQDLGGGIDQTHDRPTEEDPGHQLTEHSGLTNALGQCTAYFGSAEHDHEQT
jgi:hypothetical protein